MTSIDRKRKRDGMSKSSKRRKPLRMYKGVTSLSTATLVRNVYADLVIPNGVTAFYGASYTSGGVTLNTTLYPFNGATDIANLYDAYRITLVKIRFMYNQNSSNVNQNATDLPFIFMVNDYDDVATTNVADVLQRDGMSLKVLGGNPAGNDIRWSVVPKVASAAYSSAVATGYLEPRAKQWVSSGGPVSFNDVVHYGTKFIIDTTQQSQSTGTNGTLRVLFKVFFEAKHAR